MHALATGSVSVLLCALVSVEKRKRARRLSHIRSMYGGMPPLSKQLSSACLPWTISFLVTHPCISLRNSISVQERSAYARQRSYGSGFMWPDGVARPASSFKVGHGIHSCPVCPMGRARVPSRSMRSGPTVMTRRAGVKGTNSFSCRGTAMDVRSARVASPPFPLFCGGGWLRLLAQQRARAVAPPPPAHLRTGTLLERVCVWVRWVGTEKAARPNSIAEPGNAENILYGLIFISTEEGAGKALGGPAVRALLRHTCWCSRGLRARRPGAPWGGTGPACGERRKQAETEQQEQRHTRSGSRSTCRCQLPQQQQPRRELRQDARSACL